MARIRGLRARALRGACSRPLLWAGTISAAVALSPVAYAQTTPPTPTASTVETVVVTAQKREEDVSKVPVTVQAIQGEALERQGIKSVKELITQIPGASLAGETSQGTEVYQMRGTVSGDTTGDATVASYLDDFAFSIPAVPFAPPADLYDLNRVEVLKGPQGTLYGSSSLGGVIKIVTNNPDLNDFKVSGQGSVGSVYQHATDYSGDVMINAPIIAGKLGVRAVLSGKHLSGFDNVPAIGLKNANNSDTILGRVKILFQPNDKLSITGSIWRFEAHQDFTNRMDGNDPPVDGATAPGVSPTDYTLYTATVNYDLGWADFTSATGYIKRNYSIVANGCQVDLCYHVDAPNHTDGFHQELRLSSKGDSPLRWIGGLFYLDANNASHTDFVITNPPLNIQADSAINSKEAAAFGEVSYDLMGGKLRPLVGLRYSIVKRTRQENSITTYAGTPISVVDANAEGHYYHISPRFNLSYFPTEDGMIYVNVAEGYRPGALQTSNQVVALQAVLGVTTSERLQTDALWSYEVGTKWAFFDRTVNVALSVYKTKWDRAQLQTGKSGASGILNVGDVDGQGVELYVSQRTPVPGLRWAVATGWNSTKLKNIDPHILAGLPFLYNGMQLPPVPKTSTTLMVNYERPTNYYDVTFLADARYTYRSDEEDLSTGRRASKLNLFSADVGFKKDNYTFQVYADNISNDNGPTIWEQGRMIVPRPRTVGVRFAFDAF